jgi:hypothetical protein
VKEYLEWFSLTYQIQGGHSWIEWQRSLLPATGGIEDQPAKLMEALDLIAREENALIRRSQRNASSEHK